MALWLWLCGLMSGPLRQTCSSTFTCVSVCSLSSSCLCSTTTSARADLIWTSRSSKPWKRHVSQSGPSVMLHRTVVRYSVWPHEVKKPATFNYWITLSSSTSRRVHIMNIFITSELRENSRNTVQNLEKNYHMVWIVDGNIFFLIEELDEPKYKRKHFPAYTKWGRVIMSVCR